MPIIPRRGAALLLLPLACAGKLPWRAAGGVPYRHTEVETVGAYRRTTSQVMVRRIAVPTRANLDWAAYHGNFMIADPAPEGGTPRGKLSIPEAPFKGVLEALTGSIAGTPLTDPERLRPLALVPLAAYVAAKDASAGAGLEEVLSGVREETWGFPAGPTMVAQAAADTLLHEASGGKTELWVKVELQPWFAAISGATDEDGDGVAELYGRVRADLVAPRTLELIRGEYATRALTAPEVKLWANQLSSLWYPSYNTDLVSEAEIERELPGKTFPRPAIVMRGKPQGKATYNVFLVGSIEGGSAPAPVAGPALKKGQLTPHPETVARAIEGELAAAGSWAAWAKATAPFTDAIKKRLKATPPKVLGLPGEGGFLFFRRAMEMVVGGDLEKQPRGKNPVPPIVQFKDALARRGIDLLFVPVPTKVEILPDKLDGRHRNVMGKVVNPYGRKLLLALAREGVEVVDLWPAFLKARAEDASAREPLYQRQDTHWTARGLQLAARAVAERIKSYPWYKELKPVRYTTRDAPFTRYGDIHSRLAESEKRKHKPEALVGRQVIGPDGKPYEDAPESPIVVLGDSYTAVYELIDCQHAGVSAHIAKEIGHPVDLVMSYGGGPNVRQTLMRAGEEALARKRLVIYMMTARDLYDFRDGWEPLPK